VTGGMAVALAGVTTINEAAWLANAAGAVCVSRLGATAVSQQDIITALDDRPFGSFQKVLNIRDAVRLAAKLRARYTIPADCTQRSVTFRPCGSSNNATTPWSNLRLTLSNRWGSLPVEHRVLTIKCPGQHCAVGRYCLPAWQKLCSPKTASQTPAFLPLRNGMPCREADEYSESEFESH
jgi:hypothetical protein